MAARFKSCTSILKRLKNLEKSRTVLNLIDTSRHLSTSWQCFGSIAVKMPALSPTMTQGTITKWYKNEGDAIAPGDILCDIETDKATVSFELEEEGILAKIIKPDGSRDIALGTLIAVVVEEGDDWKNAEIPVEGAGESPTAAAATPSGETPLLTAMTSPASGSPDPHSRGYGPAVRSLLDTYQLNMRDIPATGPHGRLLKGDILQFIKSQGLKPIAAASVPLPTPTVTHAMPPSSQATPPAAAAAKPRPLAAPAAAVETEAYQDIPLTNMRKVIARRLTESKTTIPHAYSIIDCDIGEVSRIRKELKTDGIKVSVNDFIVKACAVALKRVPEVNAIWGGESPSQLTDIDISVAVATDNGLITPIIKNAIGIGIKDISEAIKDLAGRAREGKLQLHEFQGGSFTISNLGMFGISEFSAVINPPQACILAIGSSRVVPDENGQPMTVMTVQLSSDARIVDDILAAKFLGTFKETMENPMLMLSQTVAAQQSLS